MKLKTNTMERKDTKLLLILLIVGGTYLALLFAGLYFTYKHNQEQTMVVSVDETQQMLEEAAQCYSLYLQDVGYSKQWADHKANVETGLSPVDSLYYSIDQD
jgi:uncharacterized membrane protein YeiB